MHPSRWREGIAGAMLDAAEAAMAERGYVREQLWTPEGAPAERFYAARGLGARRAPRLASVGRADGRGVRAGPDVRVLLGAFGDPGHAFPVLALGAELVARGHDVGIETWERWREPAEAAGMTFSPAPEYQVFPTLRAAAEAVRGRGGRRAGHARVRARRSRPDVAVSDILTPAPALAAELEGVPVATLVPHVMPDLPPGLPAVLDRRAAAAHAAGARALARRPTGRWTIGLEQGRREYNDCRARLGLGPLPWTHTGLSRSLTMVGTFPQLEYPRGVAVAGRGWSGR